jgi:hypothetical protein
MYASIDAPARTLCRRKPDCGLSHVTARQGPTAAPAAASDTSAMYGPRGALRHSWLAGLVALATAGAAADDRAALLARHESLRGALEASAFGAPLVVTSRTAGDAVSGEVDAIVTHPFARVRATLATPAQWCEVLTLHINVKSCRPTEADDALVVDLGRKFEEDPEDTERIVLAFELGPQRPDYLGVRLHAAAGPVGTRDYRLSFEAVPLPGEQSYVHLAYGSSHGAAARLALASYLATVGRERVGFTREGQRSDGTPILVGGLRGAIERNAMRYYLAIDACLATAALPPAVRRDAQLEAWARAAARYPRQLGDLTREEYLAAKQGAPGPGTEEAPPL